MSGRDLRNFVVNHRADESEKLVRRVTDGHSSQKYKPVDYEKLKQLTAEKKFQGQEKLVKVKKIQQASKQGREQNVLKSHKAVWRKEFLKLNTMRKKLQAEIDIHMRDNADDDDLFLLYRALDEHETHVSQDLQEFKMNTVDPVWTLREDLQYWVAEYRSKGGVIPGEHPDIVKEQIQNVKYQQAKIIEKLKNEEISIEQDLEAIDLPDIFSLHKKKLPKVETGIPEEAFDLECPDFNLKSQVLQEFILIDDKYTEKLVDIEEQHSSALSSDTGDWTADDHLTFLYVMEQYPYDVQSRRSLYIDRLKKHLPHKNRAEIVEHEEWYTTYKHLHDREKALMHDWLRDRRELFNKAKVTFHEACLAAELEDAKEEHKAKQKELCQLLYSKVQDWREKKLQVMQLEEELAERKRKQLLEEQKAEEENDKKRRTEEKAKIDKFHKKQADVRKAQEEADHKRLEDLKEVLEKQAAHDRERVKYREEQYSKKQEEFRIKIQEKEEAELEKERILEAIRQQVRPEVEGDLLRLWADTEAVKQKHKREEEYINIQQPLYSIPGFTSKQVTNDPRYRIENELRNAGLLHNDYARQIIASHAPAPKPQMQSNLFK